MLSYLKRRYPDLRLVRMSDGRWSVIRDLGLVKGGKGLRCHECVFSFRLDVKRLLPLRGKEPRLATIVPAQEEATA